MAVIASSAIVKSGSNITGNTPAIVIVQTASGYAPDPGHAGTGTVVAELCPVVTPLKTAGVSKGVSSTPQVQAVHPKPSVQNRPAPKQAATSAAYLQLVGTIAITGQTTAFTGDTVTAFGSGFCSTGCSPVTLMIGRRVAAQGVPVGADGKFTVTFTVDDIPSRYIVTASQTAADGSTLTDSAPLVVALGDEIPATTPVK
jgi:hypothetical protein